MSKTTPEEAKALAQKYCLVLYGWDFERLAALIDEVRGVDAEPVAWRVTAGTGWQTTYQKRVAEIWSGEGRKVFPMYGPAPSQPAAQDECSQLLSTAIGVILSNKNRIGYQPNSPVDKFVREAAEFLKDWPRKVQPAAPVELPVVGDVALLQHALKLADRLPDSEIAYTLRLHLNGLMELPDCSSDAANAAIDKELTLRNYPANSANAGRAGWEAARKFKLSDAQAAIDEHLKDKVAMGMRIEELEALLKRWIDAAGAQS